MLIFRKSLILLVNIFFINNLNSINIETINNIKNNIVKGVAFNFIISNLLQKSRLYEDYGKKLIDSSNPFEERLAFLKLSCIDNPYFIFNDSWLKLVEPENDQKKLMNIAASIGEKQIFFSKLLRYSACAIFTSILYFEDL